ncbi:ESSS subunit of NADH:ubiquinone oxidoreductase-domain-containing protein [Phaeosphaeria sp. MPI-PUGE-AT-0046c]|nr:ESSS subunit of NADH:ubiquinone oxidoreductase-domain-containing protein [Phaeosphaeria sp. MPI-PUGE-AT-0046c]
MSSALRAAARLRPAAATASLRPVTRAFSQSQVVKGGHGTSYDPPSGWLFGVKPGEKYEKEGWEGPMYWGFCGSLIVATIAYAFKPDTSIQTWALEEARRRLEAEGILPDPDAKKD